MVKFLIVINPWTVYHEPLVINLFFVLAGAEANSAGKDKDGAGEKKPKKNRCHTCKKKVGLTGQ